LQAEETLEENVDTRKGFDREKTFQNRCKTTTNTTALATT
jgi:hypothetical protein